MNLLLRPVRIAGSIVLSLAASHAYATTCLYDVYPLVEYYERAEGIVVAQVLGCADDAAPVDSRCPDDQYHLETIETLKAPTPWKDYSGTYKSAGFMGCGLRFEVGASYLLFMDEEGRMDGTAGGALKGARPRTRQIRGYLDTLRDYRDGKLEDLSEPWFFFDNGMTCTLNHNVPRQGFVSFVFTHQSSPQGYVYKTEYDENGNPQLGERIALSSLPGGGLPEMEGPDWRGSELTFLARFPANIKTELDSATISIGDQTWGLRTLTSTRRREDGRIIGQSVADLAQGKIAREILTAMLPLTDVTLNKRAGQPVNREVDYPSLNRAEDVAFKTRTTQLAAPAEQFMICINRKDR